MEPVEHSFTLTLRDAGTGVIDTQGHPTPVVDNAHLDPTATTREFRMHFR